MAPDPDSPKPRYLTHEEFARQRASKLIRRNPPPVRDPDNIQLPSLPPQPHQSQQPAAEIEVNAHDKQGNPQKIIVRVNLPSRREIPDYRRRYEPDETGLMAAAIISFFVPLGFLLALWPAFAAKGPAKTVAIISLALQMALILLLVSLALNSGDTIEH
jgi:hypothetical protein